MDHRDDPRLSITARTTTSNAIRDLLDQAGRPGMHSLAGGLPDPGRFPTAELAAIADRIVRHRGATVLQYGPTAGDPELRAWIAATTPSATGIGDVIVTTGSQQALHLLSQVLLDPGDVVVVADAEYLGALQAFRARGARPVGVPVDAHGLDVDHLAGLLAAGLRPRAVYLVPHFHNPTGTTLGTDRRLRLLELATAHDFVVIEDDPYRDLYLDGGPPATPGAHDRLVALRSVSKVLAPGLRVGWLVGPRWLTAAVERAKQATDLHTSGLSQAIVARAVVAPWYADHVDGLRRSGRRRRDTLIEALDATFGDRLAVHPPSGGMFAWARFEDGTDTSALLRTALDHGVAFVPGAAFAVDRPLDHHLRLSWATVAPTALAEAVERLAAASAATTPATAR